MKKLYFLLLFFLCSISVFANHITGGEIYYTYTVGDNNTYNYHVTLKLFRDCNSTGAALDPSAAISIFSNSPSNGFPRVNDFTSVPRSRIDVLNLSSPNPCIANPPLVCYQVGFYEFDVTLPATPEGYIIAYQRCCRITGINNLIGSSSVGATYTAIIPGTNSLPTAPANNSARFRGVDTVIICANNSFCYDFGATDPDPSDSLVYSFCNALSGGSTAMPAPNPPLNPSTYTTVPYANPYDAGSPLGSGVSLNTHTGLMCGVAPPPGIYVVTVCVNEYRNGILIATQRKDLQIKVGDCNIASAQLKPVYPICDGFTRTFSNEAPPNPAIHSYFWDFGVTTATNDTSISATPTFTYPDTGVYVLTLIVNKGEPCSDTAYALVKVYPGFFPGFTFAGICANRPTQFTDTSRTRYGFINSWRWDFGDLATLADTSHLQNPTYNYPSANTYRVQFIVTSNKGCIDTIYKDVAILNKPPLSMAFADTLICRGDNVQLHATGTGSFSWTPLVNIINASTPDPTVNPPATQKYYVLLTDNSGCTNTDSVNVRVVNFVALQAKPDTTVCLTDSLQLFAVSDGLRFQWSPAADFTNATLQNPFVRPRAANNIYTVQAFIGSCSTTRSVTVKAVPYPTANAGPDTVICYYSTAQLHGQITGSLFTWSPTNTLTNFNTLNPIATPRRDTSIYILTVRDTLGCPKPFSDTVKVIRLPKIIPFAGRDTSVIAGQPLQFFATGGRSYTWIPSIGLTNPNIPNPVGRYDGSFEYITYRVIVRDSAGCADSAFITVRIFKTVPKVFVPSAFTPNGDNKNDIFRPIAVGIDKILYFRVFNRWGQLVFETTENGKGWDGRINGREQKTDVYVWLVEAVDYLGNKYFDKGTSTLIR